MLQYMTAGESHGKGLMAILEGVPSGVKIDQQLINLELKKRQSGYGRGKRMKIESDKVKIYSGLRKNHTTGAPIALFIENKDKSIDRLPEVTCPRPGHADLAGMLKYNTYDARDILERASARETASRVAVGSICKQLLGTFGIDVFSHIMSLGSVEAQLDFLTLKQIKALAEKSSLGCADKSAERLMKEVIDHARKEGDTLGGVFEIAVSNVPAGLGSCMDYRMKLDAKLALELISIQAIKGVDFGAGFNGAGLTGSQFHDAIYYKSRRFMRKTNHAGGFEGGMSNGEPLCISCFMKPISTLMKPLNSVSIRSKKPKKAATERSDVCALTAASVVGENVTAFVIASAMLEKFGGDSLVEIKRNYEGYLKQIKKF